MQLDPERRGPEAPERILVIDDNPAIHQDYDKILGAEPQAADLDRLRAQLFDDAPTSAKKRAFQVDHALQGEEGVTLAQAARQSGRPYSVALVDMRMPPGIDGLETVERLWRADPDVEVVICTAFSDHSWEEIARRLDASGRLLILKKPFDGVEILQVASTLSAKWRLARENESHVTDLETLVAEKTRELERQVAAVTSAAEEARRQADALTSLNVALRRASEEAGAANRAKSEFLTNMSHEIRTPMTAILGFAELLSDPALPRETMLEHVATIQRNGEFLVALVNDILDLARIEAGAMQLERLSTSPAQIVDEVAALMRVRAAEKGLALDVECVGDFPATVTTDPLRLRQVLVNLVGNAIKFTERGAVKLRVQVVATGDDARFLAEVSDSGIGIAPEALARLFQAFSQADASTSRRFGGSGLGLSITKRLCELLGGSIHVESAIGQGSTFRIEVAAAPIGRGQLALTPAEPTLTSLVGRRVLLAEDGRDNQRLIGLILSRAGAQVDIACDGRRALEMARVAHDAGRPYDVVLMDMQMPEMDGYEATRALRATGYAWPIVALTAHAMSGDRERCISAGVDEYETKPIDRARLLAVCARLSSRAIEPRAALPTPVQSADRVGDR